MVRMSDGYEVMIGDDGMIWDWVSFLSICLDGWKRASRQGWKERIKKQAEGKMYIRRTLDKRGAADGCSQVQNR